jgi:hypothetical protein
MAQTCWLVHDESSSALEIYHRLNFPTGNFSQEMISGVPYCLAGLPVTHVVLWTLSTSRENFLEVHGLAKNNRSALDFFPGRFTFKAISSISAFPGGIRKFPYRGVKRCGGKP